MEGRPLRIEGGNYQLCDGDEVYCGCGGCFYGHRLACMERTEQGGCDHEKLRSHWMRTGRTCASSWPAPYFLFREDGMDTVLENPAAQAQSGAGIQAAQFLVDQRADVLITVRCGQNAAQVFQAAGIEDPPVGPQDRRGGPGRAGGRGAGGTDPVPRRLPRCDMKIACLSGKGGAGKTLVAVNLAAAAGRATHLDCDVEEPNGPAVLEASGDPDHGGPLPSTGV